MSHIVEIKTKVRDVTAIRAACHRLKLTEPIYGATKLYAGEVTGWAVQLTDWKYPIVCQTDRGQIKYDHYNGRWGDQAELDRFLQAYAVEMAKLESRRRGHSVTEQSLADGSIKLTINVEGAK